MQLRKELKNKLVRISKLISHAGVCSRKEAEELIINGKVKVNNRIFKEFVINNDQISSIKVNNKIISKKPTRAWILNKPIGFVSSNKEQYSQKSIFRLLPSNLPRVVSVGRLDINSGGLILFTNNPTLSTYLEDPKNKIERKYIVKVFGNVPSNLESKLKKKIIVDGIVYEQIKVKILTKKTNNNLLEMKLIEGKNREIRKILNNFDLKVKQLTRVSFGPFNLNKIESGKIIEIKKLNLSNILKSLKFNNEDNFR